MAQHLFDKMFGGKREWNCWLEKGIDFKLKKIQGVVAEIGIAEFAICLIYKDITRAIGKALGNSTA